MPSGAVMAAEAKPAARASRVSPEWRTAAAAVTDAALLSVMYGLVLGATAAVCGRPLADLFGPGLPALLVMVVLLTTIYFVVFAGVEGRTPGMRVFGLAPYYVSVPSGCRSSRSVRGACSSPRHRSAWSWHRAARRRAT